MVRSEETKITYQTGPVTLRYSKGQLYAVFDLSRASLDFKEVEAMRDMCTALLTDMKAPA